MLNSFYTVTATSLLLSASAFVWAAETLGTITITDSADDAGTITTGEVEHSEFTGVYKSIANEQLQRRDVALNDILAFEAGVQTKQIGGLGSFSSVSIRAAASNQTAIYLDGVKLNSGSQSSIDLSTLELLNVENVDIYRGSSPIQLSNGAIGGSVNLKTLTTNDEPVSRLMIGAGSFASQRLQASHQSRIGAWDIITTFGTLSSDNDFVYLDGNGSRLNPDDDTYQTRNNTAVDQIGGLLRTAYRWNKNNNTKLLVQMNDKLLGVPEWRNAEDNQASYATANQHYQLVHSITGLREWNATNTIFIHNNDSEFDDTLAQVSYGSNAQHSFSDSTVRGSKTYVERVGSNGTLGSTLTISDETLNRRDAIEVDYNYTVTRSAITTGLHYAWFNANGNVLVTPSFRTQSINDQYSGISRLGEDTHSSNESSPQLGVLVDVNEQLKVRANIGHYFREPSFYELFGSRGLIRGNEDLIAEKGINADIGFSYNPDANWKLDISLFTSKRSELITTVFNTLGIGKTVNAGEASVVGIEIEHQWKLTNGLSTDFNVTWQDAHNIDNSPTLNYNKLPGEAALSAFARVAYKQPRYRAWAETEISANRFYDVPNLLPAKDSQLLNIGLDWYWKDAQTSLAINNAGNEVVEDFNGYPRPGRAFFITTTLTF